ncbi:MAG TPA: DUF1549 domain-containing protein [Bryobacteraceae bacterium]|nr:DUF1549 domain-containing protein [Bryobacteraceae bacterium]
MRLGKLSLLFVPLFGVTQIGVAQNARQPEFFESKIRPVLANQCFACHNSKLKTAGLDLSAATTYSSQAGERILKALSYQSAIKMPPMGKLKEQELADLTAWIQAGAPWPQTASQKSDRTFWSFQPVKDYPVPEVKNKAWVKNPVDAFILAKLEEKGLTPAKPADKLSLLRRATFDLTGLPPTPKEMEAFLEDSSPDAFAKVVDRLLASPQYGERWGRHWLDVARYADSTGADEDIRYPYAWRYRDYVINAFNRDLPYDQFLREQLAGDLLPAKSGEVNREGVVATGFLAIGLKLLAEQDKPKMVYDMIDEQIDTTTRALMGLTVACARCHDHKFDPIPTRDYYSLAGFFASTKSLSKVEGTVSQLYFAPLVPAPVYEAYEAAQKKISGKSKEIQAVISGEVMRRTSELAPHLAEYMAAAYEYDTRPAARRQVTLQELAREKKLDPVVLDRWDGFLKPSDDFRPHLEPWFRATAKGMPAVKEAADAYQKQFQTTYGEWSRSLQEWREKVSAAAAAHTDPPERPAFDGGKDRFFEAVLLNNAGPFAIPEVSLVKKSSLGKKVTREKPKSSVNPQFTAEANRRIQALEQEREALRDASPPEPDMADAVAEGPPVEQHVFIRGNVAAPGEVAPRQFLRVISGDHQAPITKGSGRLALAEWLVNPKHPLTSRVMVNRIWQYHFGQGIVRTPNNFGMLGEKPTHPELLDYLARRFVEQGWSIKAMHRLLMLSNTYQMSSRITREQAESDPGNLLYSHFNRRRLDVEEIRDGLLAVDNELDLTMGGTLQSGFGTDGENSSDRLSINPTTSRRRTVYLPLRRSNLPSLLNLFDFGDGTTPSEGRERTNVAPQALFMMNSKFISERSRDLAKQVLSSSAADDRQRLQAAYLRMFGRRPDAGEIDDLLTYIAAFRKKAADSGRKPADPNLLAWQSVCHILISSNEFIYVD